MQPLGEMETAMLQHISALFRVELYEGKERSAHMSYVTRDELCQQSSLSPLALVELETAGLLRPDHTTPPRYRSRLVGWATKLAYLLGEGWTLEEIELWARGRWSTSNPRQWPPQRKDWRPQGSGIPPRKGTMQ